MQGSCQSQYVMLAVHHLLASSVELQQPATQRNLSAHACDVVTALSCEWAWPPLLLTCISVGSMRPCSWVATSSSGDKPSDRNSAAR